MSQSAGAVTHSSSRFTLSAKLLLSLLSVTRSVQPARNVSILTSTAESARNRGEPAEPRLPPAHPAGTQLPGQPQLTSDVPTGDPRGHHPDSHLLPDYSPSCEREETHPLVCEKEPPAPGLRLTLSASPGHLSGNKIICKNPVLTSASPGFSLAACPDRGGAMGLR